MSGALAICKTNNCEAMAPSRAVLRTLCLCIAAHLVIGLPFHTRDMIPALPHGVAWPLLKALSNPVDLLPKFMAAVSSETATLTWKGACFYENEAYMEYTGSKDGNLGGGVLHIKTSQPHSWTCMDLYVFATPYRVTWDYYFLARKHTLKIEKWESEGELEYVKQHGISVFLMPAGMRGTLVALWDVLPLFSDSGWGESSNINFLEKHMATKIVKRSQPRVSNFTVDDIYTGDFLAVSRIKGRWGGFETLEKWVTGAYAGHTAVCLRDEEGKLWVGESGHENEKGEEIIVVLPWEEWWEVQLNDGGDSHVALLPLHPDLRAKFNSSAAWDYARSMDAKPYGYHNMIFSWIDTRADNFPPPLDAHLVMSVMTMWTRIQPNYAANMWNEALNKRLGTNGLDLPSILLESDRQGIRFDELLTIPESDEWIYSDGKSTSCVAFILAMYKAAGLFGSYSDSVQVTEFTIRDAYVLKFFEDDIRRLPSWCNNGSKNPLPFCQLLGQYQMELPGYNTVELYAHMNEHCPSLPPDYKRTPYC